jgi:DNA replication protein DnaC
MMQQNTLLESYLRQLKLPTFAQNYAAIASDVARTGLSCERYLLALCEAELAQRDTNRVERCIAQAKLPVLKELSQFDWSCVQGVSKTRVFELAQGGYIVHAEPILMIGNPGLGKTHVAAGLALAACRQGKRVRFFNVATLVNDLIVAQHELKLSRFMATLGKQELLVLDEFGFIPFSREGANLLFQLCSALYERVAVIITSNLKFSDWKSVMGEEHLTAALLDRLTHRAHILEFLGESFRFRQRLQQAERQGQQAEAASPALVQASPAPSSG